MAGIAFVIVGSEILASVTYALVRMGDELGPITVLLVFLGLFGAMLLFAVFRALIKHLRLRRRFPKTTLEVSAFPLRLGEAFAVTIEQPVAGGMLALERANLDLVCEEEYEYATGSGKNRSSDRRKQEVYGRRWRLAEDGWAHDGAPLVGECAFRIPDEASPSFDGGSHEIRWFLRLKLEAAGVPDLERVFPLTVLPARVPEEERGEAPGAEETGEPLPVGESKIVGHPAWMKKVGISIAGHDPLPEESEPGDLSGRLSPADPAAEHSGVEVWIALPKGATRLAGGGKVHGAVGARLPAPLATRRVTLAAEWFSEDRGRAEGRTVPLLVLHEGNLDPGEQTWPFELTLPADPVSFSGRTIRVRWRWRVEFDVRSAKDCAFTRALTLVPPEMPVGR